jgi:hypothetical protein
MPSSVNPLNHHADGRHIVCPYRQEAPSANVGVRDIRRPLITSIGATRSTVALVSPPYHAPVFDDALREQKREKGFSIRFHR